MTDNKLSPKVELSAPSSSYSVTEVDLKQVAGSMSRHKSLIAKISVAAFIASTIYAFTRQPVWEGQFEIVLANRQSSESSIGNLISNNANLANIIGGRSGSNKLETELEILESPSILKPIFEFVKSQKQQQGIDVDSWRYSDWQSSLTIELVQGTSVLELAYRDTHRHLDLPDIQKISYAYQAYSGRDRARSINQGIQYLDQQIEIYAQKSLKSLRIAQEYIIEQDLPSPETYVEIEKARINAVNRIRNVDEQLIKLNQLDNKSEMAMYIGRIIPELADDSLPGKIDQIDSEIALLRAKFTDQDNSIRRLVEERQLLVEAFKQQIYGYLYAQKTNAQALLKASERPKDVLIKYRELIRTAKRDEETLAKLESERQILALEQARAEDPWELISTPTLLDYPVEPRKKRIAAGGLLAGLLVGCGIALIRDRRSDLVFNPNELKYLLPCPLIKNLPAKNQETWSDALDLLAAGPLAEFTEDGAIALIPLGEISTDLINAFSADLTRALNGRKLVVSSDLRETSHCAIQLLITTPGVTTRTQLSQFRQKLSLQGVPVVGWILLDPTLNLS